MDSKKYLSEILGYYKHKVDNDLCTVEEMESVSRAFSENMVAYGTIKELAEFYGKSTDAVKSVIKNKMIQKPKRNTALYRFDIFAKLVPKWHKKDYKTTP